MIKLELYNVFNLLSSYFFKIVIFPYVVNGLNRILLYVYKLGNHSFDGFFRIGICKKKIRFLENHNCDRLDPLMLTGFNMLFCIKIIEILQVSIFQESRILKYILVLKVSNTIDHFTIGQHLEVKI